MIDTSFKTSFIITARNEPAENLEATLRGLAETTEEHEREIVLIDDGSESPIPQYGDVRLVRNEKAIGISRSRRLGAQVATGDVLVWLDAHMSFAQGWLQEMLAHADAQSILCSAYWNYALTRGVSYGADYQWPADAIWDRNDIRDFRSGIGHAIRDHRR